MYKNLREYINFLESKNELIRVKEFVDPIYEITEFTDRISKLPGGGKAILFENTGTNFPVVTNIMGSEKRILYTLGVEKFEDITERIDRLISDALGEKSTLMSKLKMLPTLTKAAQWLPKRAKGKAACQEIVNHNPNLEEMPILKCWPQDGGRFITLPLVHTNSPITGQRNVGMYRMQVFEKNLTGMHWHRHKTGANHYDQFQGDKMPVTVCLGGDPIYTYAATAPLPEGIDEYLFAGFLRGKGVELTKCITNDIMVPADCDFVIEGYVDKKEAKVVEGPFGDHTGFYSLEDLYPTFHITCITHRKDAIYPATIVGVPPQEDKYIAIATEKIFLAPIKFVISPEIEDLYLPEEGVGHNFAIVKIKKKYPGQGTKVANAMWGAGQMMFNKIIVVIDSEGFRDKDIRNHTHLAEYIKENFTPKRDTYFSKGPLDVLDHTSSVCGFGGKLCIDATKKLPEETGNNSIEFNSTYSWEKFITYIHPDTPIPTNSQVVAILDTEFDLDDSYHNLWLLGGNADMDRDVKLTSLISKDGDTIDILLVDARKKITGENGFSRPWPDIVTSSDEVKKKVDRIKINL